MRGHPARRLAAWRPPHMLARAKTASVIRGHGRPLARRPIASQSVIESSGCCVIGAWPKSCGAYRFNRPVWRAQDDFKRLCTTAANVASRLVRMIPYPPRADCQPRQRGRVCPTIGMASYCSGQRIRRRESVPAKSMLHHAETPKQTSTTKSIWTDKAGLKGASGAGMDPTETKRKLATWLARVKLG